MPIGTCDPASRGEAFNVFEQAQGDAGEVLLTVRYGWDGPRSVSVSTVSGSQSITAPAGSFGPGDLGRAISGAGIPAGSTLSAVVSDTAATLSAAATATGTITATIAGSTKETGCDGPLVNGTGPASNRWAVRAQNTGPTTYYAHTRKRSGQVKTYTLSPAVSPTEPTIATVTAQQAANNGYSLRSDFDELVLTTDPTPPSNL